MGTGRKTPERVPTECLVLEPFYDGEQQRHGFYLEFTAEDLPDAERWMGEIGDPKTKYRVATTVRPAQRVKRKTTSILEFVDHTNEAEPDLEPDFEEPVDLEVPPGGEGRSGADDADPATNPGGTANMGEAP